MDGDAHGADPARGRRVQQPRAARLDGERSHAVRPGVDREHGATVARDGDRALRGEPAAGAGTAGRDAAGRGEQAVRGAGVDDELVAARRIRDRVRRAYAGAVSGARRRGEYEKRCGNDEREKQTLHDNYLLFDDRNSV